MSKDFLTLKDAANRLGSPSSTNMNFIHKDGAILSGADPTPLSSYSLYDFPADDDIIKILPQIFYMMEYLIQLHLLLLQLFEK